MSGLLQLAKDRSTNDDIALSTFTSSAPAPDVSGASMVESFFTDDDGHSYLNDSPNPLYTHTNGATSRLSLSSTISSFTAITADSVAGHLSTNGKGRTISLTKLCDVIDECRSLQRAHILSVECYRERSWFGVLHRTLVMQLRRPKRQDVWLRVDRIREEGTSLFGLLLGLGTTKANDVAQLAGSKGDLLEQPNADPESRIAFVLPPALGAFQTCFQAICEELSEYRVWPENCWFMCSLLQEHLLAAGRGSFALGQQVPTGLNSPFRSRVWYRILIVKPDSSQAFDRAVTLITNDPVSRSRQHLLRSARQRSDEYIRTFHLFLKAVVYDILAIQSFLIALPPSEHDPSETFTQALSLERALSRQQYPSEALTMYGMLAHSEEPIFSRLRVLNITRALYNVDSSRHWEPLMSQLAELAEMSRHSNPSLSHECLAEAQSIVADDPARHTWFGARGVISLEPASTVFSVAFSPDGKSIASGSRDNTVRLWGPLTDDSISRPFCGHSEQVWSVAFSPDGKQLVSGSCDGTVQRWDVESGGTIGEPIKYASSVSSTSINCVAFSPDGRSIASCADDGTIHLWCDSTSESKGKFLRGHSAWVCSLAFSPDGMRIVSGSGDRTVRLWDVSAGQTIGKPLKGHTGTVTVCSVAFSHDGKFVLSGSVDCTLQRWDAKTGEPVGEAMKGHTAEVFSVAFSPNDNVIASGSNDYTVRLWSAFTGRNVGEPLRGHMGFVHSVAFSPDGERIVSGSRDGTIRVWESIVASRGPDEE